MLRSMTAFARQDLEHNLGMLSWELRSVNHRYLELQIKLPDELRRIESAVRESVNQHLNRGKLECILHFKPNTDANCGLSINEPLVQRLNELGQRVNNITDETSPLSIIDILKWPGVLATPDINVDEVATVSLLGLENTLLELIETRQREGEKLQTALLERWQSMTDIIPKIRARLPEIQQWLQQRLQKKFDELKLPLDESRFEQEMVILLQKLDIEEELKRLETHLEEINRLLTHHNKPVGRRLDFLMQELNREANTLCSKSMDVKTTQAGVDLKVLIEQMREQIQNIE